MKWLWCILFVALAIYIADGRRSDGRKGDDDPALDELQQEDDDRKRSYRRDYEIKERGKSSSKKFNRKRIHRHSRDDDDEEDELPSHKSRRRGGSSKRFDDYDDDDDSNRRYRSRHMSGKGTHRWRERDESDDDSDERDYHRRSKSTRSKSRPSKKSSKNNRQSIMCEPITDSSTTSPSSPAWDDHSNLYEPAKSLSSSPWILSSAPPTSQKHKGRSIPSSVTLKTGSTFRYISTLTRLGHVDIELLVSIGDKHNPNQTYIQPTPKDLLHGAIVAFGYVFEFTFDTGIDATEEKKYYADNTPLWEESDNFTTTATPESTQAWLKSNIVNFNQGTYHIVDKNCLTFTQAMGKFLGGHEPEKFSSQRLWLHEHRPLGVFMQEMLKTAAADKKSSSSDAALATHKKPDAASSGG